MAGWLKRNLRLGIDRREVILPVTNDDRQNQQGNAPMATAAVNIETTDNIPGESEIDSVSFIIVQSQVRVGESEGRRKMIGEDAFAKVYVGRYKDSSCAVKIFTDEGLEYAKSELRLAEKLSKHGHENIVLMLGIWMDDLTKQYSLVMELCDKTLFDHLADIAQRKEISTFPIKQKLLLLRDISRAMVFLHGKSILHLDLHAANVLLLKKTQDGEERYVAKVCDFGRSVFLDTSHKVEITTFGKEEFMPPEVLAKSQQHGIYTLAIDVFSYGCLILHVLTCKFPKPEKGGISSFGNRRYLMTNIKGDNHQVFQPLIQQCLADEPAERGNFPSIDTKLAAHFKYYGMEAAENLNEKTVENEELRGQLDTMRQKAARLQEVLEKLSIAEGTIEELQKNKVTLNQTNRELQGQLEAKNKDIENKNKELHTANRILEELQNKQVDALKEVGPMFNEFRKANEENAKLRGQLAATEEKLKAADNDIAKLKGDCKEYRKEITKIQKAKDDEEKLHLHTKDHLSKKTSACNEYVDKLRNSLSQKAIVEDEKRKLEEQVKVLVESLQTASGDLEDSRAKRKESANHLKKEKEQNRKLQEEKSDLQSQNEKLCDEITTLKGKKEELKQANDSLTKDIKKVKDDFAATQNELNQYKQVNGDLKAKIEKTSADKRAIVKEKEELMKAVASLKEKEKALTSELAMRKNDVEAKYEENAKLKERLYRVEKGESQVPVLSEQIEKLEQATKELKKKLDESKKELDDKRKDHKVATTEVVRLQELSKEKEKVLQEKGVEIEELENSLHKANTNMEALEKINDKLEHDLYETKSEYEKAESEVKRLEKEMKESYRQHEIREKRERDSLLEKIQDLQKKVKEKEELLTQKILEYDELSQTLRECEKQKKAAEAEKQRLEEKEVQLSEVQSEMTALQCQLKTLREEKSGLQHGKESHISEVKRLQGKEKEWSKERTVFHQEKEHLNSENQRLQRALDQKNLDLAKLQGQVVDLESLRSNYQALLVKKTQVECESDELQKKYSEAVKRVVDMEKKHDDALSDLEKKLTLIHQERVEQATLEKDKEIEQLKKILQAKHLSLVSSSALLPSAYDVTQDMESLKELVAAYKMCMSASVEIVKKDLTVAVKVRTKADEAVLSQTCWFPFGIQELLVEATGGDFPLDYGDSLLEVPGGAFEEEVVIRYGIALHGPWELPERYTPCSVTVYLNLQGHHPNKELTLHLSNWYGGKERDAVRFVQAPHVLKEGESKYQFTLLEEGDFSNVRRGKVKISKPKCLYGTALLKELQQDKDETKWQISAVQRKMDDSDYKEEVRILFTVCSCNWSKLIEDLYEIETKWTLESRWISFSFSESDIYAAIDPPAGPGWKASLTGCPDIELSEFHHEFSDGQALEDAVENYRYPPYIKCSVKYTTTRGELPRRNALKVTVHGTSRKMGLLFDFSINEEPIHSPTPLSGAFGPEAMPNSLALQSPVGMIPSLSSYQPSSTIPPSILKSSSEPNEVRPSLDAVPSDEDLQVYVVNKCASQYRTIGTLLRLDYETIDSVRGNASLQSVKDKCFEVLMHWKRTRAAGENTWRALLDALKKEDTCRVVVEELERALNS